MLEGEKDFGSTPDEKEKTEDQNTSSIQKEESKKENGENQSSLQNEEYEISKTDLHIKTRKFLEDNGLSVADINDIFYRENGEIKPLYEDLNCTQMSESQIRLALLSGLENGLSTGEFTFDVKFVRDRCKDHKCYDGKNFIANFRNNDQLWDDFSDYKEQPIKISTEGKTELAIVIKDVS